MTPQFKNLDELTKYLENLEGRIKELENEKIRKAIQSAKPVQTNLINKNFFVRAFTVWGHFMTANLIIGITLSIIIYCAMFSAIGALLQGVKTTIIITPTSTPWHTFGP